MKIFISGLPRSGKTTLVKKIYEDFSTKIKISGFYTEEISIEGKRMGFKIYSIDLGKEFEFAKRRKEKDFEVEYAGYYLNLKILDEIIDKVDLTSKLIIIDEIGKMEMMSKKFENFINEILNKNLNILATVHRSLAEKYKKFGKFYWLERENWEKVYKEIKFVIENYL